MSMSLTTGAAATVNGGRMAVMTGHPARSLHHPQPTAVSMRLPPRPASLLSRGTLGFRSRASASASSSVVDQGESESESRRTRYHFLVASAKFMLDEEEHFKELLFERLRYFGERNKTQNFWLVVEPKFLDGFPDIARRLRRPAVALVSTDATWIT